MDALLKVATFATFAGLAVALVALALWGYLAGMMIREWWRYRRIGR